MLKNYLKIALRTLGKHKLYTAINVFGLAVGMACCVLIFMLVRHEWSFDTFHENAGDIYKLVIQETRPSGELDYRLLMPPPLTPNLAASFPNIDGATRVVAGNVDLYRGDEIIRQRLMEADSSFFEMFTFPLVAGDTRVLLRDPTAMVITEKAAETLFDAAPGTYQGVIGEVLSIERGGTRYDFNVVAVAASIPNNSSLQFDAIISFENYGNIRLGGNDWGGRTSTFIQLAPGDDPAAFQEALKPFTATELAGRIEARRGADYLAEGEDAFQLILQPLRDVHLNPTIGVAYESPPHDPTFSYILAGIALLVLVIACINFMTLSIGRSTSRAREVGMRKVLGAQRGQLMKQFWGEALILSCFSLLLGAGLAALALPWFNDLTGQELSARTAFDTRGLLGIVGLMAVVGLIAGGYPAAVLSRFRPAAVLKGAVKMRGKNYLTRSLVVVQYTISVGLIVCTVIMAKQLDFMLDRDLGYDRREILVVQTNQVPAAQSKAVLDFFRNELLPYEQVTHVARMGYSFTRGSDRNTWADANGNSHSAFHLSIDFDTIDMMEMEVVAGRSFSRETPTDSASYVLVNEALVQEFGLTDPVGHKLTGWGFGYMNEPTILGVVKDFNYQSLRNVVEPVVIDMHPNYYSGMGAILVKMRPGAAAEVLPLVEATWNEVMPGKPYAYSFLDDDIAGQYQGEQQWRQIITYSSLFAILIACLGLFGLATLSVAKRTKEIGIRKVLGASASGMLLLISKEFVVLVGIATVLAWPLAYFGMNGWLDDFAYRVDIGAGPFILAGVMALGIALLAISYHALRAAHANPVEALRYE